MPPARKQPSKRPAPRTGKRRAAATPRQGGQRVRVPNSGLEVWLYDDANLQAIRAAGKARPLDGGMPAGFDALTRKGLIVGYSLCQDDEVDVEVHVGAPFTGDELAIAPWLEPQTALLRLPSGAVCVESNDASRVGGSKPGAKGGRVEVPPGDYRLTLYRIDHEALDREGRSWDGPQEIVVLSPGGKAKDAAKDLLPFQPRRDRDWIGRYRVQGQRADALAWFGDYWDTAVVNLDAAAIEALALAPGRYLRVAVPSLDLALLFTYGESWNQAQKFPLPAGVALDEFGYAALSPMADWDGAQALFCRRSRAKTRAQAQVHKRWLPATVEVLDLQARAREGAREFAAADLASKAYFNEDFLGIVLCDLLPEAESADEFPLPQALAAIGRKLKRLGFEAQCDLQWDETSDGEAREYCCRLYRGERPGMVVALACEGIFELLFVTALADGGWIVTGLADDFERMLAQAREQGANNAAIRLEARDEALNRIASAHDGRVAKAGAAAPSPGDAAACGALFARFIATAFDRHFGAP